MSTAEPLDAVSVNRIYVSGPMTGLPRYNFAAFADATRRLIGAGFDVCNPGEKGVIDGWEWVDYLRYDLRELLDCDAVALLPGWERSRGASLEKYVAEQLGYPVDPVDTWLAR